jgi:hypothetical protein
MSDSVSNQAAFDRAVEDVTLVANTPLDSLVTQAPAWNREIEAAKTKARAAKRYGLAT